MDTLLACNQLSKHFGGLKAVDGVDFKINSGEIVSLIGPNGAGKTTFFNLLTGFARPTKGNIYCRGKEITNLPPHKIASLGVVRTFQATKTFSGVTVMDGLIMGAHRLNKPRIFSILANTKACREQLQKITEDAEEILDFFKLSDKKDILARNLSYGDQRVLQLAVALIAQPELLLLDEPTTGMNPTETRVMMDWICKLQERNITILLVEHDMNVVMNISDRVVVLNSGQLIAEGLPEEIQRNKDVIKAYLGGEELYA